MLSRNSFALSCPKDIAYLPTSNALSPPPPPNARDLLISFFFSSSKHTWKNFTLHRIPNISSESDTRILSERDRSQGSKEDQTFLVPNQGHGLEAPNHAGQLMLLISDYLVNGFLLCLGGIFLIIPINIWGMQKSPKFNSHLNFFGFFLWFFIVILKFDTGASLSLLDYLHLLLNQGVFDYKLFATWISAKSLSFISCWGKKWKK